jgi:hypothetical protein
MPDTDELLELAGRIPGHVEASVVTHLRLHRQRPDGEIVAVDVEVHDRGHASGGRWSVVARDEHGREASGNPDASLEVTFATVHWQELDR